MSQFEATFEESAQPEKTSGLAIAALVCSLILCCPITTALGVLLGLIAAVTAKKGKGMAVVAIAIGLIATIVWVWGINWGYKTMYVPVLKGPEPALTAGFAGDTAGMTAAMTGPASTASDAEAQAFIDELRSRYGELQGVMLDPQNNQGNQPPMGSPEADFDYLLTFDNGTISAQTTMVFADQVSGKIIMKPSRIVVYDDDLGNLEFPPTAGGNGG